MRSLEISIQKRNMRSLEISIQKKNMRSLEISIQKKNTRSLEISIQKKHVFIENFNPRKTCFHWKFKSSGKRWMLPRMVSFTDQQKKYDKHKIKTNER